MDTKNIIYMVLEYASQGEIYGKKLQHLSTSFMLNSFAQYANLLHNICNALKYFSISSKAQTTARFYCLTQFPCYLNGVMGFSSSEPARVNSELRGDGLERRKRNGCR